MKKIKYKDATLHNILLEVREGMRSAKSKQAAKEAKQKKVKE